METLSSNTVQTQPFAAQYSTSPVRRVSPTGEAEISHGTENFVAAVEEIAASSEQQSASIEEIAGFANQLTVTSDRLTER